jgi:hypothetical protein
MDSDWFMKQIAESPYGSLRKLAPRMRNRLGSALQVSALSRMISGERDMQLHEARQLADLLGQPMSEIIRRAGIPFGRRDNLPEEADLPVLIRKTSARAKRA